MNIGQAAKASGVTAKMIRYYESVGLVPAAGRGENGYRDYGQEDVQRLGFVRRARELGFSMDRIRALLALWSDRDRGNAEVRAVALAHVADLEAQERKLHEMVATLRRLAQSCRSENRDQCPIMAELSGTKPRKGAKASGGVPASSTAQQTAQPSQMGEAPLNLAQSLRPSGPNRMTE